MRIFTTSYFERKHSKLINKNPRLSEKIDKQLALFQEDPTHPSLRLHKLVSKETENWSISIKANLRIIFQYVEEGILVTDIGSHDEVY